MGRGAESDLLRRPPVMVVFDPRGAGVRGELDSPNDDCPSMRLGEVTKEPVPPPEEWDCELGVRGGRGGRKGFRKDEGDVGE